MTSRLAWLAAGLLATSLIGNSAFAQDLPQTSPDGLEKIDSKRVDILYWRPGATLAGYKRVMLLEPTVSFRKDWQRNQNRERSPSQQVSASDMERIRELLAKEFLNQFKIELQDKNGYELVDTVGEDVLVVHPAIVDLDVAAPDIPSAGRTRTYVTSAGAMTLYAELFDSSTNELIGRVIDRREARTAGGRFEVANRVTNLADAQKVLRRWAGLLRRGLDDQWSTGR